MKKKLVILFALIPLALSMLFACKPKKSENTNGANNPKNKLNKVASI